VVVDWLRRVPELGWSTTVITCSSSTLPDTSAQRRGKNAQSRQADGEHGHAGPPAVTTIATTMPAKTALI